MPGLLSVQRALFDDQYVPPERKASYLEKLEKNLQALMKLTPLSTEPTLELLRRKSFILMPPSTAKEHDEGMKALELAVSGAEKILPAAHPNLALLICEWARLAAYVRYNEPRMSYARRTGIARDLLVRAKNVCDRAFGPGSLVSKGLEGELAAIMAMAQ